MCADAHTTALRSNLSCAAKPPNPETLPRWRRTFCSLAPQLCGLTAARHADVCAQQLRAHTSACLTAPRSNLSYAAKPPNLENITQMAAYLLLTRAAPMRLHRRRACRCTHNGSKVKPFLCGKAAYMRKILYICSMVKNLLTFCRAFLVFLVDNKHCLWCIIHRKKWW